MSGAVGHKLRLLDRFRKSCRAAELARKLDNFNWDPEQLARSRRWQAGAWQTSGI